MRRGMETITVRSTRRAYVNWCDHFCTHTPSKYNSNVVNFARNDCPLYTYVVCTLCVHGHLIPWCRILYRCSLFWDSLCDGVCMSVYVSAVFFYMLNKIHASHELAHMTEWEWNTNIHNRKTNANTLRSSRHINFFGMVAHAYKVKENPSKNRQQKMIQIDR